MPSRFLELTGGHAMRNLQREFVLVSVLTVLLRLLSFGFI